MEPNFDRDLTDEEFPTMLMLPVGVRTGQQRARRFRIHNGFLVFLICCLPVVTVFYFGVMR